MATALFISRTDLVKNSIIDGNTDTDLFIQYVKIAQEIHIQSALGSKLYNKISEDIASGNLIGDYLALVTDYVQPMLIHYAMVDFLPFCAYQVKSGGIYKHSSENSETVNKDEVDFLVQKEREFAEHYTRRFVDFICFDTSKFPEYNQNVDSDVYPTKNVGGSNWVI